MPECDGLTLNIHLGIHSLTGCRSPKCYLINVYTDYLITMHPILVTIDSYFNNLHPRVYVSVAQWTDWVPYNKVLLNNKYKISLSTTHRSNWLLFHSVCINVGALILDLPNYINHTHSHIHTSWHTHNYRNIHGNIRGWTFHYIHRLFYSYVSIILHI